MNKEEVKEYETITIREYISNSFLSPISDYIIRQIEEVDQNIIGEKRNINGEVIHLNTELTLDSKMTVGKNGFPIKEYDFLATFGLKDHAICVVFCNSNRWNCYELREWDESLRHYAQQIVNNKRTFSESQMLGIYEDAIDGFLGRVLTDLVRRGANGVDYGEDYEGPIWDGRLWEEVYNTFSQNMRCDKVDEFMTQRLIEEIKQAVK